MNSSTFTFVSSSAEDTQTFARRLGRQISTGTRIALIGTLGTGKTCFTQGLAEGLECIEHARSPSYVLINNYQGRCVLNHCDWYRLDTQEDVESSGFEDLLRDDSVLVVEWADRHPDWLPEPYLEVRIEFIADNDRAIELRVIGEDEKLAKIIRNEVGFEN